MCSFLPADKLPTTKNVGAHPSSRRIGKTIVPINIPILATIITTETVSILKHEYVHIKEREHFGS